MNTRNAMGFPANPTVGDFYEGWEWDGEKWVAVDSEIHANIEDGTADGQITTWAGDKWSPNDAVIVGATGNVGVNVANPTNKFEVNGPSYFSRGLNAADRSALVVKNTASGHPDSSIIECKDMSDNTLFRVSSQGNVGIGRPNPETKLQVKTATATSESAIRLSDDVTQTLNVNIDGTAGGGIHYENPNNGYQRWTTSGIERMRIDASGLVGIGTNDPRTVLEVSGSTNRPLTVNSTNTESVVTFTDAGTTSIGHVKAGSSGDDFVVYAGAGPKMTIDVSGKAAFSGVVTSGSGRFEHSSNGGIQFSQGDSSGPLYILPRSASGFSDGVTSIGFSDKRFKDGYFSGTVNSNFLRSQRVIQDGSPVVDSLQIIRAFMKLRDAVDDPDSTVEQLRDKLKVAVVDIIDQFQELVDAVELEVSTMPAPEDS